MKASIDKLRWVLAGGSLCLLLLLVAVVSYGRYKAAQLWKHRLSGLGVHIEQTTDNVTYSQTIQGRTVFTLRAGKAVQRKDGKTVLHNVQLTLYGKHDGSEDRIYGSEFEYDEKAGVARALGDVEMDLRVPGSLVNSSKASANGQDGQSADADRDIHVRTSGLTYVRKLGVAATDQQVMFRYAGLQCTAKGAEFDSSESIVHLLADVALEGTLRGKQVELHAAKADLNHNSELVNLLRPELQSGVQRAAASSALLHLRRDGSLENAEADGSVVLQRETQRVTAAHLESSFLSNNLPSQASLTGGVVLTDTSATKPMHGSANRLDGEFNTAGAPTKWVASGGAQLQTSARDNSGHMYARSLRGNRIEAVTKPGKKNSSGLSDLHVIGGAQAFAEAAAQGGLKTTEISADDLDARFAAGNGERQGTIQTVVGTGHTRLQQSAPGSAQQISTGDRLQLNFVSNLAGSNQLQISSASQTGNVRLQSRAAAKPGEARQPELMTASAEESVYDGASEKLTLKGNSHFSQGGTILAADSLVLSQQSGDSDALGNVLATLTPAQNANAEATHIHADRAHLVRDTQIGVFRGSDAVPARLWQGASQVEAATISIDGKKHILQARTNSQAALIRAVFASEPNGKAASTRDREAQVERISASTMDYEDAIHVATFAGNLHAQGQTGQMQAQHAQIFFAPASKSNAPSPSHGDTGLGSVPAMSGSLQRAVVWGDVHLSQPGKTGRGDRLVYTAADQTYVLTGSPGHPPQIVDSEHGSVSGASLLFRSGDNTVVVSGSSPIAAPEEHVRVHTETGAKP